MLKERELRSNPQGRIYNKDRYSMMFGLWMRSLCPSIHFPGALSLQGLQNVIQISWVQRDLTL